AGDADRRGHAGAGADGSLPQISRAMRRRNFCHSGDHAHMKSIRTTSSLRIAVVAVSSLIGAAVIEELRERKIAPAELHALDDARSAGGPAGAEEDKLTGGEVAALD